MKTQMMILVFSLALAGIGLVAGLVVAILLYQKHDSLVPVVVYSLIVVPGGTIIILLLRRVFRQVNHE